jgi:hypothetical protein
LGAPVIFMTSEKGHKRAVGPGTKLNGKRIHVGMIIQGLPQLEKMDGERFFPPSFIFEYR